MVGKFLKPSIQVKGLGVSDFRVCIMNRHEQEAELYKVGQDQPSYDKQPVRDWLIQSGWNKGPPAPMLPTEVIVATTKRYE